ncbi:MAG: 3-phosphoshikimate 1-carboxyvinyltransferase [Defluviitaleaceae bacterium]|nr:3-phosphoshikimate 1-carboxyvinyltransferase [Defluviitaleaceae bacterium]
MVKILPKKNFNSEIFVPGDKSISHRAVILGAIAEGVTEIKGFLIGDDCLATINCLRQLGVKIDIGGDFVRVYGKGLHGLTAPKDVLYCGNSGTTMRLLCGLLAGQKFDSILDGDKSLQKRPMKRIIDPLRLMGAKIETTTPPIKIKRANLKGVYYKMPIHSAQVKSALILAGLYAEGETVIEELEKGATRNHTELMLNYMMENGILTGKKITVCGDFSSAAFFIVLGLLLAGEGITIRNVGVNPTRTGLLEALRKMGGDIKIQNTRNICGEDVGDILVKKSDLTGIEIDGKLVPKMIDEVPIFAVAAAFAKDTTIIKDAAELAVKESNRLQAMATELSKMGVSIASTNDSLTIIGTSNACQPVHGATLYSHNDHRIAMSLAIAATAANSESTLNGSEWIDVSFPNFLSLL